MLIMENHGKIKKLCYKISVGTLKGQNMATGLQKRVGKQKFSFLFLTQNICCGYLKELH